MRVLARLLWLGVMRGSEPFARRSMGGKALMLIVRFSFLLSYIDISFVITYTQIIAEKT
jgi:hypothetical protein